MSFEPTVLKRVLDSLDALYVSSVGLLAGDQEVKLSFKLGGNTFILVENQLEVFLTQRDTEEIIWSKKKLFEINTTKKAIAFLSDMPVHEEKLRNVFDTSEKTKEEKQHSYYVYALINEMLKTNTSVDIDISTSGYKVQPKDSNFYFYTDYSRGDWDDNFKSLSASLFLNTKLILKVQTNSDVTVMNYVVEQYKKVVEDLKNSTQS